MNQLDDQDIRDALHEIATWPSNTKQSTPHALPDRESSWSPRRLALVAATLAVFAGLSAAYIFGESSSQLDTASDLGSNMDRSEAVYAFVAIDSEFGLDALRSAGTVHQLGDATDGLVMVIADGELRVECSVFQRESGDWFVATSSAGVYLPLASTTGLSVSGVIELNDRTLVVGQAGSSVNHVEIDLDGTTVPAAIDGGWWAVSMLQSSRAVDADFPDFDVRWEHGDEEISVSSGEALIPNSEFSLCAEDGECRTRRIVELKQLAANASAPPQSAILEDNVITIAEYRSVLAAWGDCIANTAGVPVTYDDNGSFTTQETNSLTDEAFSQCQSEHATLITEASVLLASG